MKTIDWQEILPRLAIIGRIVRPGLQKKAATILADYLNQRRARRLGLAPEAPEGVKKAEKALAPFWQVASAGVLGVLLGVVAGVFWNRKG